MGIFAKEPALIIGVVMTGLALATQFGLATSQDQQVAVKDFLTALLPLLAALFIRPNVLSPATARDAVEGGMKTIEQVANTRGVTLTPTDDATGQPSALFAPGSSTRSSGYTGGPSAMALVLALLIPMIGCANRGDVRTTPQTAVAEYGTEILKVTIALQDAVIAYTKADGGNATTDAIMGGIRQHVIPNAQKLSSVLKSYDALTDPALKDARIGEIDLALNALVQAYAEVSKNEGVANLAGELRTTSARVRELVAAVRLAVAKARAGSDRVVLPMAMAH